MKKPAALVSVTNDLTTDQRVHRTCLTLVKMGFSVQLTGRHLPHSLPLQPREYKVNRMRLIFTKGPLFYAEYNIRLLFHLLKSPAKLLVSNDLDTLPAVYFAYRIKKIISGKGNRGVEPKDLQNTIRHLHDCHEYFRGVPELAGRNKVTRVWKWFEDLIFPKLDMVIAVNESVAVLYRNEYRVAVTAVRNVPLKKHFTGAAAKPALNIEENQQVLFYQGAVNIGRGLEEAVTAMKYTTTNAVLVIAGIGDIYNDLRALAKQEGVDEKVRFLGQIPFEQLHSYTMMADLGLSIEKDISVNYHFCLPNKFLDYIQAKVPVLVSPFPEMKRIVDEFNIGEFLVSHDPQILANQFDEILKNHERLAMYKKNLEKAAWELCWEREEMRVVGVLNIRTIE